ncbi:MAG TPA: hypothetical protein VK639_12240 [Terriglobales bacterium]|nr:hypothetical protein [Terriglobales bacterium]
MKAKSDARLDLLVFGVFSAGFWNPNVAQAADTHVRFEGEKTTWHEGFDRFDYVMDEESFAITPFMRPEGERFAVGNPPKDCTSYTMNTITNLALDKARTLSQPPLFARNNGRMDGEFDRTGQRHFQHSAERRNHDDGDNRRVSERVTEPKRCLTNQIFPVADQFPQDGLGVPLSAAIGSGGRRHGNLTNCERTRQRESAFGFFQSFEGSVRSDSGRKSV